MFTACLLPLSERAGAKLVGLALHRAYRDAAGEPVLV
jgi:hypothetical protein